MNQKLLHWSRGLAVPAGFALIILLGAGLLMLPAASAEMPLSFGEALFTAISATCVTGLTLIDTGRRLTVLGQAILLLLIQVGGLGFMTLAAGLFQSARRRISLHDRLILEDTVGHGAAQTTRDMARAAVRLTFGVEGAGALLLALRFVPRFGWVRGLWYAVFHSISAFCNAGFDLMGGGQSLSAFVGDAFVNIVILSLIILGGLGFIVLQDLRRRSRLQMQTRLVLCVSAGLIAGGTVLFWLIERTNPATLAGRPFGEALLASLFQSVTCRTAGFNTISQAGLRDAGKLLSAVLMFIGAAPAGTGGGIKVTTAAVLLLESAAFLRGRHDAEAFGCRIPRDAVRRAVGLTFCAVLLLCLTTAVISLLEPELAFIDILYECASALGTAGLSCGVTAAASGLSLGIFGALMYIGRVGLLSLLFLLNRRRTPEVLRRPESPLMIG